jgi:hypothetical protein
MRSDKTSFRFRSRFRPRPRVIFSRYFRMNPGLRRALSQSSAFTRKSHKPLQGRLRPADRCAEHDNEHEHGAGCSVLGTWFSVLGTGCWVLGARNASAITCTSRIPIDSCRRQSTAIDSGRTKDQGPRTKDQGPRTRDIPHPATSQFPWVSVASRIYTSIVRQGFIGADAHREL